jgi:hypothetical protein
MKDAIALAEYIRDLGYMPEQVQDFYPTPGTISTCMYYTGLDPTTLQGDDPSTMQPVYVPRDPHEKAMQRALIQYRDPQNYALVKEALIREGRQDLIGFGEQFLIPPRPFGKTERRDGARASGKPDRKDSGRAGGSAAKVGKSGNQKAARPTNGKAANTGKKTNSNVRKPNSKGSNASKASKPSRSRRAGS